MPPVAEAATAALVVPRVRQAPTLDGTLAEGEWDGAAATCGIISQFGKVAHPRQAVFWVGYDAANVYLACRSTVLPAEERPKAKRLRLASFREEDCRCRKF